MNRSFRAAVGIGLAASLFVTSASAAPPAPSASDVAAAQSLFEQAKALVAKGQYADACPKFAESDRLDPGAGTEFNLADCYEHVGRTASAWAEFSAVADALKAAGQTARADVARARAEALAPKLVRLAIVVPPASRLPGLEVKRDGETVGDAQWGAPVSVDPGAHVVDASAPGLSPWHASVDVRAEGKTVTVEVPKLAAPAPATPPPAIAATPAPAPAPPPTPATPPSRPNSTKRTIGLVLGGVGVVSLGVGAVAGILALGNASTVKDHCDASNACDQQGVDAASSGQVLAPLSTITLAAGAVLAGAGAYLFFSSGGFRGASAPRTAVVPLASPHGGGAAFVHAF